MNFPLQAQELPLTHPLPAGGTSAIDEERGCGQIYYNSPELKDGIQFIKIIIHILLIPLNSIKMAVQGKCGVLIQLVATAINLESQSARKTCCLMKLIGRYYIMLTAL